MENVSDGYHTFGELYRYRMLYNAAFFNQLAKEGIIKICKSHKHFDGEECFGGGWFIVMAELPTGQISNHYENQYWNLFNVPEQEKGFKWDGHSPNDAADRIEAYLKIKGDIVMQFDNSKAKCLISLMNPDGMNGYVFLEGNPIEKKDIKNIEFNPDEEVREAAKNFFGDKFEKLKVETNVILPFETILIHLKQGHVITRGSWTDTVVFRQVKATIASDIVPKMQSLPDAAKAVIMNTGGISYNSQCLIYNTSTGVADSWCPTVDDILAEDWVLYKV